MKRVRIVFQFQYADALERLLDAHEIVHWTRAPMIEGRDADGKHEGSQAFPGNVTVVEAMLEEDGVEPLFDDLRRFRDEKPAHRHLTAAVLPVERVL